MVYNIFVIVLLVVIIFQFWYITRLRKAIEYAAGVLKKYETALLMDDIIRKVNENESKTDKAVSK